MPLAVVASFAGYITNNRIVAACGIHRPSKQIELSDWVVGEAHRLFLSNGAPPGTAVAAIVGVRDMARPRPERGRSADRIRTTRLTPPGGEDAYATSMFEELTRIMVAAEGQLRDAMSHADTRDIAG